MIQFEGCGALGRLPPEKQPDCAGSSAGSSGGSSAGSSGAAAQAPVVEVVIVMLGAHAVRGHHAT